MLDSLRHALARLFTTTAPTFHARRLAEGTPDDYRVNGEPVSEDAFWQHLKAHDADVSVRWNVKR